MHFMKFLMLYLACLLALSACQAGSADEVGQEAQQNPSQVSQNTRSQAGRVSRPGEYRGYSEKQYAGHVLESRYVEVRDGTQLAVDIFRPAVDGEPVEGEFPVVWQHTPYRRAHIDEETGERVSGLEGEAIDLLSLVDYGYVVAAVDTRGRGASFGARRGFLDRTEAMDAYDMTEWFADQPWSNGNIGIAGCSYKGASTLHAATVAPPHLKAIAPGCFAFDSYRMVRRGGIAAQFNTRPENPEQDYGYGVAPVDADADDSLAEQAIEIHHEGTPMGELWRGMPYRDSISPLLGNDFWRETSAHTYREVIESSGIGIFMWGNWLDEGSFQQTLAFNNLDNPTRLWMGGWGHCQVGDFPMGVEIRRFFDYYLKGIDNGWEDEPPVYYYTLGEEEGRQWSTAETWPPQDTRTEELFLSGEAGRGKPGSLLSEVSSEPGEVGQFTVDYSPECQADRDMYFLFWPCVVEDHGVSYETPPLAEDVHILGHPVIDLQMSASTEDADLFAYLEKIDAEGNITIMTTGRLRASHRKENEPDMDYWGLPYHRGLRGDIEKLRTGEPVSMHFDLLPTSIIVEAGSRLRLTVAGADPRQRWRNVSFDPAPTIRLQNLEGQLSRLRLPVASGLRFAEQEQ